MRSMYISFEVKYERSCTSYNFFFQKYWYNFDSCIKINKSHFDFSSLSKMNILTFYIDVGKLKIDRI